LIKDIVALKINMDKVNQNIRLKTFQEKRTSKSVSETYLLSLWSDRKVGRIDRLAQIRLIRTYRWIKQSWPSLSKHRIWLLMGWVWGWGGSHSHQGQRFYLWNAKTHCTFHIIYPLFWLLSTDRLLACVYSYLFLTVLIYLPGINFPAHHVTGITQLKHLKKKQTFMKGFFYSQYRPTKPDKYRFECKSAPFWYAAELFPDYNFNWSWTLTF
jgi:hypothetical protein